MPMILYGVAMLGFTGGGLGILGLWPLVAAMRPLLVVASGYSLVALWILGHHDLWPAAVLWPLHRAWRSQPHEFQLTLPGDGSDRHASLEFQHAVTIQAPPAAVWPWLLQLGPDRAGFYSYDWLERAFGVDIHNVATVACVQESGLEGEQRCVSRTTRAETEQSRRLSSQPRLPCSAPAGSARRAFAWNLPGSSPRPYTVRVRASATILVVDDERLIRWSLVERLRAEGYQMVEAATGGEALERIREGVDLILLDYKLPDTDGVTVLRQAKEIDPDVLVVMLTAFATVDTAVEAMKIGAYHFANKPFNLDDIVQTVQKALETTQLRREVRALRATAAQPYGYDRVVGDSSRMTAFKGLLRKIAESPASTVLLTGESGTGKDLAAKVLHYNSARAHRPFMNITCSAIPEALLESELFGHERGAFTDARQQKRGLLESADGGTVFLDEIGEMQLSLQAKLLRFLEEKSFKRVGGAHDIRVDVRIVSATNRNLEEQVKAGKFRADLYYRLNVLPIELPPLRARLDDVPALARFYVDAYNREFRKSVRGVDESGLKVLQKYDWPGNIRELRNAVERAMLLAEGPWLRAGDFPLLHSDAIAATGFSLPAGGLNLEDLERSLVVQALEHSHGNQTRAAALLGLNRDQIRYRIEKFSLTRPGAASDA